MEKKDSGCCAVRLDVQVTGEDGSIVWQPKDQDTTVSPLELGRTLLKIESGWLYILYCHPAEPKKLWPAKGVAILYDEKFHRQSAIPSCHKGIVFDSFTTLIYRFAALSNYAQAVGDTLRIAIESGKLASRRSALLPVPRKARKSTPLNTGQFDLLTRVKTPVDFVQGPPGTGKSTFIVEFVKTRVPPTANTRVLLCTTTNKAIDSLTEKLAASGLGGNMLAFGNASRLGSTSAQYLLDARVATHATTVQFVDGFLKAATRQQLDYQVKAVKQCVEAVSAEEEVEMPVEKKLVREKLARVRELARNLTIAHKELTRRVHAVPSSVALAKKHPLIQAIAVASLQSARKTMQNAKTVSALVAACNQYLGVCDHAEEQVTTAVRLALIEEARYFVCTAANGATIPDRIAREVADCEEILIGGMDTDEEKTVYSFEYVVLDEAGAMLEPDVIATVVHGCKSLVLVGDHLQLPPFTKWLRAGDSGYNVSLLERLSRHANSHHNMMTTQYRMPPALAGLVSAQFYSGKLETAAVTASTRVHPKPVVMVDVRGEENGRGTSYENHAEVEAVVTLVQREREANATQVINVICFHKLQFIAIQRALVHLQLLNEPGTPSNSGPSALLLDVCTVDSMQGREADVIILSCVRSGSSLGFLTNRNRINVALSRAKQVLYIVGHAGALQANTKWRQVLIHDSIHTVSSLLSIPSAPLPSAPPQTSTVKHTTAKKKTKTYYRPRPVAHKRD